MSWGLSIVNMNYTGEVVDLVVLTLFLKEGFIVWMIGVNDLNNEAFKREHTVLPFKYG